MRNISINKYGYIKYLFACLAASLVFSVSFISCKKDESILKADNPLNIATSATSVTLNQRKGNETAVELTWTTGSNQGTGASISYKLEVDKKGNGFAAPQILDMGKVTYSKKFTGKELNDLLLDKFAVAAGESATLEARVYAVIASDKVAPYYSSPVEFTVNTYKPVTSTLYLIGDATPNGWSADKATPMTSDPLDPTTFTYNGLLTAGNMKFITTLGSFLPSYNKGADDQHLVYRTEDSQPDDQFIIPKTGVYTVTLNLVDLTISITTVDQPPYTKLWIVGDATPNGWNIDNPNEMTVDPADPFVFNYYEILKEGDFKIATATGNWGCDYYMPVTNTPDITETSVKFVPKGDPDYKWHISTAGPYKISLNIRNLTISIVPFVPYTKIWMVGDATPVGWNIDNPTEMTATADPYVFTYKGTLKAGEFKFPLATGNWGCDYFMPVINHQDLTDTHVRFVKSGDPDLKWQITQEGEYEITLNQLYQTILITKL